MSKTKRKQADKTDDYKTGVMSTEEAKTTIVFLRCPSCFPFVNLTFIQLQLPTSTLTLNLTKMAAISATTTATTTISRLFSTTTKTTFTKPSLHFRHSSITPSLSLLTSKLTTPTPTTFRRHSTTTITSSISAGNKLPEATFSYLDAKNDVQTITTSDLTSSKTTILFAVPGAFTPTCSQKHVPSFLQNAASLKSKGVSTIACISVNDAFVMKAWKESLGNDNDESILFLCDVNGEFTKAIGAELDLSDKPVGLGVRSRRYAMLVEDGIVKVVNMEEGGAFTFSSAQDMLKLL